jgi:hypothetical protein
MDTMTVTLPSGNKNELHYFTICYAKTDFLQVVDLISQVKTVEDLYSCSLWNVL